MKKDHLWTLHYSILLLYSICISIFFYAIIPLLTRYTTYELNLPFVVAGFLSGLFSIVSIAARPLSGYLSDSRTPSFLLLLSAIGLGISILLVATAASVCMLAVLRIFQGILYAFSSTACFVLLNRQIPLSRLNEGIGYYGMGQILSSSLGMSLGIFLMEYFTVKSCFLVLGIGILCVAITHRLSYTTFYRAEIRTGCAPVTPAAKQHGSNHTLNRKMFLSSLIPLIPLGLSGALFSVSNGVETTFLSLLAKERGINQISIFFTLYVLILVISRPCTGRLSDRLGLKAVLYPALLLMAVESLLIGIAASIVPLIAAALFKAIGQGSAHPALQAECIRRLGYEKSGTASSIFLLFTDLGQGFGPMIVGCLADLISFRAIFSGISIIYIFALLLLHISVKVKSHMS